MFTILPFTMTFPDAFNSALAAPSALRAILAFDLTLLPVIETSALLSNVALPTEEIVTFPLAFNMMSFPLSMVIPLSFRLMVFLF